MALTAELTKTLTVALSPEMYETIQIKTDEQRISKGELVRVALQVYLNEIMKERGQTNEYHSKEIQTNSAAESW